MLASGKPFNCIRFQIIIPVHMDDEFPGSPVNARFAGHGQPFVPFGDNLDALVLPCRLFQDGRGTVRGPVVNANNLQLCVRLAHERIQAPADEMLKVVNGNDGGNQHWKKGMDMKFSG